MDTKSDPLAFSDRSAWQAWLETHHARAAVAWLVIQKKRSRRAGL
jgi:uncharacterized protein YdeI (YjbR/CyaY-like superfamily)